MQTEQPEDEVPEESSRSPIVYIIAIFLVLIVVLMVVPYYSVRLDPEPSRVSRDQIPMSYVPGNKTYLIAEDSDYRSVVIPNEPLIKQAADRIVALACRESTVCQAKALYYFVRDNYQYIADPINHEYVEDPREFMVVGGGDCESGALFLASLLESVGIDAQMVFVPNHALLRIRLDAPKKYQRDGWIYLDWTCSQCGFGEIPQQALQNARYLEVP
jgi:transglutaminase-like putative cysteine protease